MALAKDLEAVHRKSGSFPAMILISDGKRVYHLMVGQPGREWICHVLGDAIERLLTDPRAVGRN